ncbi:MAG: DUF1573 domain-containing protein [Bacteroidia bacterium]|nr:DUF1573 domain-containing protein [Bacteroidia bacterium]
MHRICAIILFATFTYSQAQVRFSDTIRNLGTIAQGAKISFNIQIYNPDSTTVTCKLSHICGCTEFNKTKYILGPKENLEIPIIYHSSGNAGKVDRGFYVEYLFQNKIQKQKIHFTAFVDTVSPFTTPVLDTFICYRFDRTSIDHGCVTEGHHQRFVYTLYNCSKKPLVISNVQSSCGCVTPKWRREPIKPGETAEIIAEYNTNGRPGYSQKNLTVHFENGATVVLTLICKVILSE